MVSGVQHSTSGAVFGRISRLAKIPPGRHANRLILRLISLGVIRVMCLLALIDWSKVFEVLLGAVLAFIFGFFLQFWLIRRQERFQKVLLDRQLAFMERLERDRAVSEDSRERARTELLKSLNAAKLDHASMLRFFDSLEK
jgi:hypothetical protein